MFRKGTDLEVFERAIEEACQRRPIRIRFAPPAGRWWCGLDSLEHLYGTKELRLV
jgi:hypothetical protein